MKKYTSDLIIEVTEGFVLKCTLQQIIYLIITANTYSTCYVNNFTEHFTYGNSITSQLLVGTTILPILQMKKLRHRKSYK